MRIDLQTLQPDPIILVHHGVEYELPAVLELTVMVEAAKIDAEVARLYESGRPVEAAEQVIALRDLLMRQIKTDPDAAPPSIPLSSGQVMQLLGLLAANDEAGQETFRRVVAAQLEGTPGIPEEPAPDPLPSPPPSPRRSSRSRERATSRRAGTGK